MGIRIVAQNKGMQKGHIGREQFSQVETELWEIELAEPRLQMASVTTASGAGVVGQ
jgi:hypothetical protein